MKGKAIVLTVEPKGKFSEGTADAAIKAGTMVDIKAATEPVGGRYTLAASATARYVVRTDELLGRIYSDTIAAGERVFAYLPESGDEFNALFLASEGAQAIGDEVGPDAAGKFIALGTGYKVMETITVPASDTLVHVEKL